MATAIIFVALLPLVVAPVSLGLRLRFKAGARRCCRRIVGGGGALDVRPELGAQVALRNVE
eukprot:11141444-Alexandrium_andersonii.AAC.1